MSERLSIAQVAEATGANPKTVRAYLRRNHARAIDAKGSRWGDARQGYALTVKVTQDLLEHFAPADEEE